MKNVVTVTVAASATLLASCFPVLNSDCDTVRCGPCPPPLTVFVKSSSVLHIPEVTMKGAQGECSKDPENDRTVCSLHGEFGPGTYEFDLEAPNHQTVRVTETVEPLETEGCCGCGYVPRTTNVVMTVIDECAGITCGACAPALTLYVTRSGGGPVPGLTVKGVAASCDVDTVNNRTSCVLIEAHAAGTYTFDLEAPSYQTLHVSETVPAVQQQGCCACGYEPKTATFTMSPI